MTHDSRQERLKETLLVLESVPPADRRAWVLRRLADDPAMADEVLSLLKASESSIAAPSLEPLIAPGTVPAARQAVPQKIGPYTIESMLGQGGMSYVYRAFQVVPVRRTVAIKVLRTGIQARELLARFELERDTIARLSHQNIAKLLDAGTDDAGCPYIAMDLVDGPTITEYAKLHQLPLRDRLALFLLVCRGVQHAHGRGILHRDIKPSNILVAEEDGRPVPKVIDFGLAKLLRPDQPGPDQTQVGQVLGTIAYMSPEQADPRRPDADVRSDLYSLGVVLYELLTEVQPISSDSVKGLTPGELHERLLNTRPKPPSRVHEHASPTSGPTQPSIKPVPRELDCLVLKAMEPDPERRYAGVGEFIADIERYLSGHPIQARPPSVRYRLRKFVWRNRWPTALASVGLAALLAVAIAIIVGYRNTVRQRDRAERAAATFEATSTLLRKYLLTPRAGPNGSFTQIVARGADDFLASLPESPTVRARVAQALGESLFHAGDGPRAKRLLEIAVKGFEDPAFEADTGPMRETLLFLSLCRLAALDQRDGQDASAIVRYRDAIKLGNKLPESDLAMLWTANASLANALSARGEFEEALTLLDTAIASAQQRQAGESLQALLIGTRAGVLGQVERFDEAIAQGEACMASRGGPNDRSTPYTIMLAVRHGATLVRAGQPARAAAHLEDVNELSQRAFGENHAQTLTVRRHLAEARGLAGNDPSQLLILDELLKLQSSPRTREAIAVRKARVSVLSALNQTDRAIDESHALLADVDAPSGEITRESAILRLDLARSLRKPAPTFAKQLATSAHNLLARELGPKSIAAQLAHNITTTP